MKSRIAEKIEKNFPLAPLTTFKIGGLAEYFFEARAEDDLSEAVLFAKENKLPANIIGGASNILINDAGLKGLVIKISGGAEKSISLTAENDCYLIKTWAGESLAGIVRLAGENGLTGLEWASGIPGSIGGAVRGNAGAFGGCMADNAYRVRAFDTISGQFNEYGKKQCHFGYRQSLFKKEEDLIIASITLKLEKGDKKEIEEKMKDIIKRRVEKQPKGLASAGSFFINPEVEDEELVKKFEKDTGAKCRGSKLPAGWLIAEAGLTGKRIGDIAVSEDHANFIVNLGQGTAGEVIMLASFIKQKIRTQFGVQLKEEVRYLGFD